MGQNSSIEWTTHTFNPWRGCTKVSPGCLNCYADTWSKRNPKALGVWGPNGQRVIASELYWKQPRVWNEKAKAAGERHRVFCASLADVGEGPDTMPEESWPHVNIARVRLSVLIMECESLDFLLLTKRPENMTKYYDRCVLERCWVGTSIENQNAADQRIPHLLQCPAAVRFLSIEPLLGPVDLRFTDVDWPDYKSDDEPGDPIVHPSREGCSIDWVIVGCESGPRRRQMDPAWARSIRDQCRGAGVPFFMKQMEVGGKVSGDMNEFPEDLRVREFPIHPSLASSARDKDQL